MIFISSSLSISCNFHLLFASKSFFNIRLISEDYAFTSFPLWQIVDEIKIKRNRSIELAGPASARTKRLETFAFSAWFFKSSPRWIPATDRIQQNCNNITAKTMNMNRKLSECQSNDTVECENFASNPHGIDPTPSFIHSHTGIMM